LQQERAAADKAGDQDRVAYAANDLGVVYLVQKRLEESRAALSEAQRLFIVLDDAVGQGRALGNLAQVEERAENGEQAAALYMQAADLLHEGKAFADEYTIRRRLSRYYTLHGATWMALHESANALAVKPDPSWWDKLQGWLFALPLRMLGLS
jgi:tetratricopeptide (TPR) repeat protein